MEANIYKIKRAIEYLDVHDKHYSDKIHTLEFKPQIELIIYYFARLFNPDFIFSYFIIILIQSILMSGDYYFVCKPIMHTVIALIITLGLKKLTNRQRPHHREHLKRIKNLRQHEKDCSMPSGDSLQAANFAMILFMYFNTYFGFLLIPCVMFSRIFYFCHYLSDTIVGSLLGLIISNFAFILLN